MMFYGVHVAEGLQAIIYLSTLPSQGPVGWSEPVCIILSHMT